MKTDVLLPQMGESIAEGTIARWLKKVGDVVDRDEPLFELSTDKVDAEIPAPASGVLVAIHVPEGATAAVHTVVAVIQDEAADGAPPAPPPVQAPSPAPAPASQAAAARPAVVPDATGANGADRRRASPVARRIALDRRVDLRLVTGSGGAGRVTKEDVLRHLAGGSPAPAPRPAPAPAPAPRPADAAAATLVETVPMTVMRRKIAEHMIASRRTSAHVHSVFQVDCSRVEAVRRARRADYEAGGVKLSILPFVVSAAVAALREWPVLNASLDGDTIVYHGEINVGVAVALDTGLIVPVIKRADRLSLMDTAKAIGDLARRARSRQLKPEDVAGGTFTVTNPGNFGGSFATPIINQPQVAILELGTVEKRAVVVNDALAIRPMMNLTLGFDHRLVDGAVADQFLGAIKKSLESWSE